MKKNFLTKIDHLKKSYIISNSFLNSIPKRLKFTFRTIMDYNDTKNLFEFFDQSQFRQFVDYHPSLYNKIFRSYLYCGMPLRLKMECLISHYQYIIKTFPQKWIFDIYSGKSVELLEFDINNEKISIDLCYVGSLGKEGELTLSLSETNKNRLYSIAFSFFYIEGKLHLYIGGMQGYRSDEALEKIKLLTKQMHGLRPRNLLIFVIRSLAQILHVDELIAVTSKHHISQCSKTKETGQFYADYDVYWEEEGGIKKGSFFALPIEENRKNFDDIKSNKRSMYTKRYTMMDEIITTLKTKLVYEKVVF